MRTIVIGVVAGLLGAALNAAFLALVGPEAAGWTAVLRRLFWGAVWGVAYAFVWRRLPSGFWVRVAILAVLTTAVAWGIVFPAKGVSFSAAVAVRSLEANTIYAVMACFVLRQGLDLPLPVWRPLRRAEEFRDDPAGAHA